MTRIKGNNVLSMKKNPKVISSEKNSQSYMMNKKLKHRKILSAKGFPLTSHKHTWL